MCPEPIFVGTSRAVDELHLIAEHLDGDHLPFLDLDQFPALVTAGLLLIDRKPPSGKGDVVGGGDDDATLVPQTPFTVQVGLK